MANWYLFNAYCVDHIDIASFVAGLRGHEGFGYNGGKGHETLARESAGQPENDPDAAIEPLVDVDSLQLADRALILVRAINTRISDYAADPNPSGNIPAGTPVWWWIFNHNNYELQSLITGL